MAGRTAHGASRKSAMVGEAAAPPSACSTVCSLYSVAPAEKLAASLTAFGALRVPLATSLATSRGAALVA